MLRPIFRIASASVAILVIAACGSSDPEASFVADAASSSGPEAAAAGPESGVGGASSAGGAGNGGGKGGVTGLPPVVCGGVTCELAPRNDGLEIASCCVGGTNECGVRVPLSAQCLATNLPAKLDPVCDPYDLPGKVVLPGRCCPTGCGALGLFAGVGCIPNEALGRAHVACDFGRTGQGPADASADARD